MTCIQIMMVTVFGTIRGWMNEFRSRADDEERRVVLSEMDFDSWLGRSEGLKFLDDSTFCMTCIQVMMVTVFGLTRGWVDGLRSRVDDEERRLVLSEMDLDS